MIEGIPAFFTALAVVIFLSGITLAIVWIMSRMSRNEPPSYIDEIPREQTTESDIEFGGEEPTMPALDANTRETESAEAPMFRRNKLSPWEEAERVIPRAFSNGSALVIRRGSGTLRKKKQNVRLP